MLKNQIQLNLVKSTACIQIYPCGKEYVGYGIHPDIVVKQSVKDVIENIDPVLNTAIEYLKQQ
jgi:C-terminal processing protease CtpA/Prc